jgi:ABC-type nickel/cobalt efflux system permease component RcnA
MLLAAFGAGEATAHPLGNFTINHMTTVKVSSDRVEALYILDQAEIPTFQERGLSDAEILKRKQAEVMRGVRLTVNGRPVALRLTGRARLSFPDGQGGLELTRLEVPLAAKVDRPRRVEIRDTTFADRVGWKAIVAEAGEGTAVRSTAPSGDPTNGLRSYPSDLIQSPPDTRQARFGVKPGGGTLRAPKSAGGKEEATTSRNGDGFAGVFGSASSGDSILLLLLLASFGWGAFHALSPGHGKAMVAAYLIGTRGTAKHAIGLGAIVTVTHTIGVFALGLVTLALSQYILPEDLFPWLNLVSGLLVVIVGVGVLRSRMRWARARRAGKHGHSHGDHGHHHPHGDSHDHGASPEGHSHDIPDQVTWKGLVGMGAAAGLIPCPSALVVLLGAIAQHQVALGLLLIVAFSVGLALTLTALGLAVVYSRRAISRFSIPSGVTAALPAVSAVVIVGIGFVLTANAIPQIS